MEIQNIRKLIAEAKIDQAIKEMLVLAKETDYFNMINTLSGAFAKLRKDIMLGILDRSDESRETNRISANLLELLSQFEKDGVGVVIEKSNSDSKMPTMAADGVFISYNHNDKEVANKLRDKLKQANIKVTIDSEAMNAGEDIKEFIERCIKDTQVTLSLISRKSLMSAWVAMESINTFYHEKTGNKKMIPCFIDDSFFSRSFVDDVLDDIDVEVNDIRQTISKRMEKNRPINDLQNELDRYLKLQAGLPEIVRRIKESLSIDIRADKFDSGFQKILDAIKE